MPSPPRLSASTSPFADISQPRKLLVPQSTATKAGAASEEGVTGVKSYSRMDIDVGEYTGRAGGIQDIPVDTFARGLPVRSIWPYKDARAGKQKGKAAPCLAKAMREQLA